MELPWILFLGYCALVSIRHVTIFALVAAPIVAVELSEWWGNAAARQSRASLFGILDDMARQLTAKLLGTSLFIPLVIAGLALAPGLHWPTAFPEGGGIPIKMIDAHLDLLADSRVFTTDQIADYLIFRNYPRQRVFFDSRHNYYGEKMGAAYLSVINGGHQWRSVMDEFHFNVVLVATDALLAALLGLRGLASDSGRRQLYPVRAREEGVSVSAPARHLLQPRRLPKLLSIVIPIYNEEEALPFLRKRLTTFVDGLASRTEILLVNDGSSDESVGLLVEWANADSRVRVFNLARNFGQQAAVTAGLDQSAGDAVAVMDADLQDPPEVVSAMLDEYCKGYDVVYGRRISRAGESAFKRISAWIFYRAMRGLVHQELPADAGDFRLVSRPCLDAVLSMRETHRFLRGMIAWVGFPVTSVSYARDIRAAGHPRKSAASGLDRRRFVLPNSPARQLLARIPDRSDRHDRGCKRGICWIRWSIRT